MLACGPPVNPATPQGCGDAEPVKPGLRWDPCTVCRSIQAAARRRKEGRWDGGKDGKGGEREKGGKKSKSDYAPACLGCGVRNDSA